MDKVYDIIVVGAGPAGSSAAGAAAQRGVHVLLIDQRQRIGVPVQCAEFVPQGISRHLQFSRLCVMATIQTMVTHIGPSSHEMSSPGYMLDRSLFDKDLATSAMWDGAAIAVQTRAAGMTPDGVILERGGKKELIQSKVVIAADGSHSSVARWLGRPSLKTIAALQYEIAMPAGHKDRVDIFFDRAYEGGYAWFFPKGKTANVGLGVIPERVNLLSKLLDAFIENLIREKMIPLTEIVGKTGGFIPCEISQRTVFGNILLAGDAAGHAHPITGAGILNAVLGGEMAGRIAAESIIRKDPAYLETYETEWRDAFGKPLFYGELKRNFLERNWNSPATDFEELIHHTWVGFKEYHKGRG